MAAPQVDKEYWDEIAKAWAELQNLISMENYSAWDMLRLAYASQFSIANFHHAYAGTSTSTDATTKKTQSANNDPKTEIGTSTSTDARTKNTQSANNNPKTEIGTSTSTDARTKNTQSANNNPKIEIGTSTSTDARTKNTQSANNNPKTEIGTSTSTDARTKNTQSANNNPKTEIGTNTSTDARTKNTQSAINNLKTEIETIKRNHNKITYPDLYQLAGVVALQILGGPNIEFVPGREESKIRPDEGCLPDVSVKGVVRLGPSVLRDVFHRVGISNSNLIVALCGGLKMAKRADTEKFGNSYFRNLKQVDLHMEPFDIALLDDPEYHSRVVLYATDEDAFKRDYVVAHKKLSELGLPQSSFITSLFANTQRAAAAAVAAAVAIFSVFYLIKRRSANKYSSQ